MTEPLAQRAPADLLATPLPELLGDAGDVSGWDRATLERLDWVVRHHVVRALVRRDEDTGLERMYRALRRFVASQPATTDPEQLRLRARWLTCADVVDARREALQSQDVASVLERPHVRAILGLVVSEPGVSQREIERRLGLKKANLSRLLAIMEANELVVREASGRENRVRPGPTCPPEMAAAAPQRALVPPAAPEPRLIQWDHVAPVTEWMMHLAAGSSPLTCAGLDISDLRDVIHSHELRMVHESIRDVLRRLDGLAEKLDGASGGDSRPQRATGSGQLRVKRRLRQAHAE